MANGHSVTDAGKFADALETLRQDVKERKGMSIKQLVQAGFGAFGLRLTRVSNEPKHYYDQMDSFFLVLKQRGFSPNHIVDVGANHGYWTRTALTFFGSIEFRMGDVARGKTPWRERMALNRSPSVRRWRS